MYSIFYFVNNPNVTNEKFFYKRCKVINSPLRDIFLAIRKGDCIMNHFALGLFILIIFVLSLKYRIIVVSFNFDTVHRYSKNILLWLAGVMLSVILSSLLK